MTVQTTNRIIAEHGLYKIVVEKVKSQLTLDGTDEVYAIENKETGVVEGRGATLPEALSFMHQLQLGYDNITKQAAQLETNKGLSSEHPSD